MPELETEHIVDSMRIFNGRRRRMQKIRPHRIYNWGQAHMLRYPKIQIIMLGQKIICRRINVKNTGPHGVAGIVRTRNVNVCISVSSIKVLILH